MSNITNIRAQQAPWMRGIEFYIGSADGKTRVKDIILETLTDDQMGDILRPSLTLSVTDAQTLMDDLWHCGIRPTEGTGSAGSLRATERHLEDMRKLVFKERHTKL